MQSCKCLINMCEVTDGIVSWNQNENEVFIFQYHLSTMLTMVRSSVADKMQLFGGQLGIILSDVPLKKTSWFFKDWCVSECSGKDMTYFSLFIFFIFLQWHFITFLVCGMLCFTVALWAAWTQKLEEVFLDLYTCCKPCFGMYWLLVLLPLWIMASLLLIVVFVELVG